MRHTWNELTTWQSAAELASSLHLNDGYSSRSLMPTPKMDGCTAPAPVCVDSGWAVRGASGWQCTAPASLVPIEYSTVDSVCCASRKHDSAASLSPQMPESLGRFPEPTDVVTIAVLRFTRNALVSIAVSDMPKRVRDYAACLLADRDGKAVTMDEVETLGREIVRRYEQRSKG